MKSSLVNPGEYLNTISTPSLTSQNAICSPTWYTLKSVLLKFLKNKALEISQLPFQKSLQIHAPSHSMMVQYLTLHKGEIRLLVKISQSADLKRHDQNQDTCDTRGLSELSIESEWLNRR